MFNIDLKRFFMNTCQNIFDEKNGNQQNKALIY